MRQLVLYERGPAPWARGTAATILLASCLASCGPERPSLACPDCEVRLDHLVTLGDGVAEGQLWGFPAAVARDRRGRYYAAPLELEPGPPRVYDAAGRFIQLLGQRGPGPGEFERPEHVVVGRRDTLYVFDTGSDRLTVMSPRHTLVRTVPYDSLLPGGYVLDAAALETGHLVLNNAGYQPGTLPYALVGANGTAERSFGPPAPSWDPNDGEASQRAMKRAGLLVSAARGGGFWSLPIRGEPSLERWSEKGERLRTVRLAPDWRSPLGKRPPGPGVPIPYYAGLWEDAEGDVWTIAMVASRDWRANRSRVRNVYASDDNHPLLYDALIEVLDPANGRVVASGRITEAPSVVTVVQPGLVASRRKTAEGRWLVDLWSLYR